ncbi:MAG TPA: helix-turn-helix transcriptional regulator [Aquabacterium sp.]|nr:helix-turn-helix transcriptional regulator [Aquabacterium sp.]
MLNPLSGQVLTAAQCRKAREMLGWTQAQLAGAAGLSRMTIVAFERGTVIPIRDMLLRIRHALEAEGLEFIEENGGGPGVQLRKEGAAI